MAEMNYQFTFDEDQEMETQPIYLSSDESEIASPHSSPAPQLPKNVPNTYSAITQLIAAQNERISSSGYLALRYPLTPPTSLMSHDDVGEVFTPILGNPAQQVFYTPDRRPHTLQLCPQLTPIPVTPESRTPKNRRQPDLFQPYNLPESPTTSAYPLLGISTLIEGLQDMSLHAHIEANAHLTGCLFCGKTYEQVIGKAVAHYLHQTSEPGKTVKDKALKRMAFVGGLQGGVFTFVPRGVSQAAACDRQVYTVNYSNTQPDTQTNLLPLFED